MEATLPAPLTVDEVYAALGPILANHTAGFDRIHLLAAGPRQYMVRVYSSDVDEFEGYIITPASARSETPNV
jgi:hypothetical protein